MYMPRNWHINDTNTRYIIWRAEPDFSKENFEAIDFRGRFNTCITTLRFIR